MAFEGVSVALDRRLVVRYQSHVFSHGFDITNSGAIEKFAKKCFLRCWPRIWSYGCKVLPRWTHSAQTQVISRVTLERLLAFVSNLSTLSLNKLSNLSRCSLFLF